jgi:hypothetical protein
MDGTNNAIYASNTSGSARDAAIDLGASTVRWKDLYLSGSAYVSGTGVVGRFGNTTANNYVEVIRTTTSPSYINIGATSGAASIEGGPRLQFSITDASGSGSSEAMRIDSSGNLLVGKTSDDNTITGLVVRDNGFTKIVRNSSTANVNSVLQLNRLTSDGDIVDFRKDGSAVGSIGTVAGDFIIGSSSGSDAAFRMDGTNNAIYASNTSGNARDAAIDLGASTVRWKDLYLSGSIHGDVKFENNAGTTEYARFDSSGNLLAGKTSQSDGATAGHELLSDGRFYHTKSGDHVGRLNRLSTDGDILRFAKDGSTVGSIGVDGDGFLLSNPKANSYISLLANNQSNGIFYQDSTSSKTFSPYSARTGEFDLGGTGGKWKDLYLSGGVYLGGTGSANKLDDYEESSFGLNAASDATGSLDGNSYGYYVKVGSMVTVQVVFQCTANFTSNKIGDLPFVPINHSTVISTLHGGGVIFYGSSRGFVRVSNNDTKMYFTDTSGAAVNPSTTNDPFRFTITYRTS